MSLLITIALGCACETMPTVAGGSAGRNAHLQELLDIWLSWAPPVQICEVTLVRDPPGGRDSVGTYNRTTRSIRVMRTLSVEDHELILRHELCHAVDFQEGGLHDKIPGLLIDPHDWDEAPAGDRGRAEAFAEWCEVGPEVLALSARPEAAAVLAAAWPGFEASTVPMQRVDAGSLQPALGWFYDAEPIGAGVMYLKSTTGSHLSTAGVQVDGCEPLEGDVRRADHPPRAFDVEAPGYIAQWPPVTLPDGRLLAVGRSGFTFPDGAQESSWLLWDGEEWSRADDGQGPEPLRAVTEGGGVSWGIEANYDGLSCFSLQLLD